MERTPCSPMPAAACRRQTTLKGMGRTAMLPFMSKARYAFHTIMLMASDNRDAESSVVKPCREPKKEERYPEKNAPKEPPTSTQKRSVVACICELARCVLSV
mmetsp:Transcript_100194/g.172815  ORF Transcript_100194/g.172815 Transcript_100194/m.172815 type:complete len:102 (+) Transcript_100194:780-1085(+)